MRNPNRCAAQRRANEAESSDTLLIYNTNNGATQQYAEWLAKALDCDVMQYSRRKLGYASMYKNIIFGSWIRGGEITRFSMLRQNLAHFGIENNNIIVFASGLIDSGKDYYNYVKNLNGCKEMPDDCFYLLPGRFSPDKCKGSDKLALKALGDRVFEGLNGAEKEIFKNRFKQGYDGVSLKEIQPIIEKVLEFKGK